jgi:Uma2 family endonuclease
MSILAPSWTVTPEELLAMPDSVDYELVDGKLVERHAGMRSSEIAAQIAGLLGFFLRDHRLGRLFGADAAYRCFPDAPDKVRKPDVSFIRNGRLPGDQTPTGYCPIYPDLAVEVISPGDLAYEVDEKVAEYLKVGVRLVWVVSPPTHTVRIHRPRSAAAGPISELAGNDSIAGEEVLPAFACNVAEFFG